MGERLRHASGPFVRAGPDLSGVAPSRVPLQIRRGVYQALIAARWEAAVARGTPALTVQAGRMSKPIVEKLGFVAVGEAHLYVDTISD